MDNIKVNKKFRSEMFKKIITGSKLFREFIQDESDIFLSDKDTTFVKASNTEKYIRINKKDVFNKNITEDLYWYLAMNPELSLDTIQNNIYMKEGLELPITNHIKDFYDKVVEIYKNTKSIESEREEIREESIKESSESSSMSSGYSKSNGKVTAKSISKELAEKKVEKKTGEVDKVEPEIENTINSEIPEKELNNTNIYYTSPIQTVDDIIYLDKIKKNLLKAFKGTQGKERSYTPSKRISMKRDMLDRDDIYTRKSISDGKYLKMNIIIDMSGSMLGEPIKNANSILYLFNELAIQGYFKGNVYFTSNEAPYKVKLPITKTEALNLCNSYFGAEGFKDTIMKYKNELINTNVICITDGNLTDKPISKSLWDKLRIKSLGIYVSDNESQLKNSKVQLSKYFHHGIAVPTVDEMINYLIKIGLKGKK